MIVRRRDFITLLGGAAAWPLAAQAQQPAMPVIGLLNGVSFEGAFAPAVASIREGLAETGFVEGKNLKIEYRSADGRAERLPALAADLVRLRVSVIVAFGGSASARIAKAATSTIPIVFSMGGDALDLGLVKSLSRPEANVTGMSFAASQLAPKRLELLRDLVPQANLIGYLDNLATASERVRKDLAAAAGSIGRQIVVFDAGTEQEIDAAFAKMAQQRLGALVVSADAFLNTRREQIVALAARHALPAAYSAQGFATLGGLVSYTFTDDMPRQAGVYAGRILEGAKISDLPVMFPTKFKLTINLKTAKTLGLTVTREFLLVADEVIE
jgi:putative ABC transport system substrate-binding protein